MMPASEPRFLVGKLLIALPGIEDPRFMRTVIYVCSHSDEGALGLIVNKPASGLDFSDLLDQLSIESGPRARQVRILLGGPVERSRGFVLHSADWRAPDTTLDVTPDIGMTASIEVLRALATGEGPARAVLALGYSGWGPGQLETEIRANGWLTADSDTDILFGEADARKWEGALQRLGIDPRLLTRAGGTA